MTKTSSGVGMRLLSSFLKEKLPVSFFEDNAIRREDFTTEEGEVFSFIINHIKKHRVVPKMETVEREVEISFPHIDEPTSFWLESFRRRNLSKTIGQGTDKMRTFLSDGEVGLAREEVRQLYVDIERLAETGKVGILSKEGKKVLERHDKLQRSGSILSGIPFGMSYLDAVSGGAQPGDFIAIAGRPEVGKSFLLANFAVEAYKRRKQPLYVGFEMQSIQTVRRILAIRAKVSTTDFKQGRLTTFSKKRIIEDLKNVKEVEKQGVFFRTYEGSFLTKAEQIDLAVQELFPDILLVDGAYLLTVGGGRKQALWERVTESASYLKGIALSCNIPVVATYQFSRKGAGKIENIGLSDAIGQLASIVLSLENEESNSGAFDYEAESIEYKLLKLIKGREGEKGTVRLKFDMIRTIIEQDEVLSGKRVDLQSIAEIEGEDASV